MEGIEIQESPIVNNLYSNIENNIDYEVDIVELKLIQDKIEAMSKFNKVGVLRILSKNKSIMLNENKYGVHINLTEVPKTTIDELFEYINYVKNQEINLSEIEKQKETFKNIYFTKDNKDIPGKTSRKHESI